jgi:hypothetical protein
VRLRGNVIREVQLLDDLLGYFLNAAGATQCRQGFERRFHELVISGHFHAMISNVVQRTNSSPGSLFCAE